ncbi:MAG: YbaB/EbfC family nucleoid-associated protein [Lewinellaceae bacterium]|nr:YbaB/EbfC family nucleoid-associated protein [Phaeodactylibacter sp.]MCB0611731.1 YbaB/EbfC family nucleoid-associated protein [Phaeodactylibacter sp.]MCB9346777.1 YbaB/EbfC family nucleoid-associated protein [Lewinellaceae bacterium]
MFGDLMGNMKEQQKEMRKKLAEFRVQADAGNGAVKVTANANRELIDIQFDKDKLDWEDTEMVQDLIIAAVNQVLEQAAAKEAEEAQNIMKNMLPPGMGDLGNLFG